MTVDSARGPSDRSPVSSYRRGKGRPDLTAILDDGRWQRRPPRPADPERLSRALVGLAQTLAHSPEHSPQHVAETIQQLCEADSAGVSFLTDPDGSAGSEWAGVAGAWKPFAGRRTEGSHDPGEVVLSHGYPLLFHHPERLLTSLRPVSPSASELLVAPLYAQGAPVGSIWAAMHDGGRPFDRGDARILGSLAPFATAARTVARAGGYSAAEGGPAIGSAQLLAAIVDSSDDAIVSKGLDGVITSWNKSAEKLFGYTAAEAIGKNVTLIIPLDRRDEEVRILERLKRGERIEHFLTKRVRSDGTLLDVSLTISPIKDATGRIVGASKVARDVTQERRLREELEARNRELEEQNRRVEEANRLKSEFLAGMSHELRTPLNSIIGFSEFLGSQPDNGLTMEQREFLGYIYNSGNHLLEIINDILDLSRIESGRLVLAPEPFSPAKVLEDVVQVLEPMLEERRLVLGRSVDPALGTVTLDKLRFKEILFNLLSNAAKFTEPGGRIDVTMVPEGPEEFGLKVKDTGIGIDPSDFHRLFRQFEQLDSGPGRRYQGSGLGLYLTKKLVEMHGGRIEVESARGAGTTFTVHLPLRAAMREVDLVATDLAPGAR
jgi:PAS domain S-box-containing protein